MKATTSNMAPAWENIAGLKFELCSYKVANNQERPMYLLNYRVCMYIATKFNDEARAKLILRWHELEKEHICGSYKASTWILMKRITEGNGLSMIVMSVPQNHIQGEVPNIDNPVSFPTKEDVKYNIMNLPASC